MRKAFGSGIFLDRGSLSCFRIGPRFGLKKAALFGRVGVFGGFVGVRIFFGGLGVRILFGGLCRFGCRLSRFGFAFAGSFRRFFSFLFLFWFEVGFGRLFLCRR